MTIRLYPSELPKVASISWSPSPQILRTPDDSLATPATTRRLTRYPGGVAKITFKFFDQQYKLFRKWWRDTLHDGIAWFWMELPTGGGTYWLPVRFVGEYSSTSNGHKAFSVSVTIETSNRFNKVLPSEVYDPHWDDVQLLLHMDGTDGDTTWVDRSKHNHVIVSEGSPVVSDDVTLFGEPSTYFDGSGSILRTIGNMPWSYGVDDFTVEMFLYATENYTVNRSALGAAVANSFYPLLIYRAGGGTDPFLSLGTEMQILASLATLENAYVVAVMPFLQAGEWAHVAVQLQNGVFDLFWKGRKNVDIGDWHINAPIFDAISPLCIGNYGIDYNNGAGHNKSWLGYMRELRITKAARYVDDFTPPTAPFPEEGPP